jgi:hypothetical protein
LRLCIPLAKLTMQTRGLPPRRINSWPQACAFFFVCKGEPISRKELLAGMFPSSVPLDGFAVSHAPDFLGFEAGSQAFSTY